MNSCFRLPFETGEHGCRKNERASQLRARGSTFSTGNLNGVAAKTERV